MIPFLAQLHQRHMDTGPGLGETVIQMVFLIIVSAAIGYWATTKNRRWWPWALSSMLVTPIVTIIALGVFFGNAEPEDEGK